MPDRNSAINLLSIALLIATVLLTALWISSEMSDSRPRLPDSFSVEGPDIQQKSGRILLTPSSTFTFNNLKAFQGDNFEITYRVDALEYDRLIFEISKDNAALLTIETSLEAAKGIFPPHRINIVTDDNAAMYYEDGKPVRRYLTDIKSATSITLKTVGSRMYVNDFLAKSKSGNVKVHESFVAIPKIGARFFVIFAICLVILIVQMLVEKRVALVSQANPIRSMARHGTVPFIAAVLAPFSGFGAKAMVIALAYFALSRIAFLFAHASIFRPMRASKGKVSALMFVAFLIGLGALARKAPALAVDGADAGFTATVVALCVLFILWIALRFRKVAGLADGLVPIAASVFSISAGLVFLSSLLPGQIADPIRVIGMMSAPLAVMVILSKLDEPVRFYNIIMFAAALAIVGALEIALWQSQDAARLKPMGIGKQFEKHDLLLWAPVGFISEDGLMQQEPYAVPKIAFRSGETTPGKPGDVYRIVTMGGSNTWGDGIEDPNDTFSAHMERILNEQGQSKKVEVINAGVKSFSSLQVLVLLKHYIVKYHPDTAVFYILRNDLTQNYGIYTLREMYEMAVDNRFRAVYAAQRLLQKSKVYNGLTDRIVSLRRSLAMGSGKKQMLKQTKTDDDWRQNIEEIIDVCEDNNIQPVFVIEYQGFPHANGLEYRQSELEQILIDTAKKRRVPLLDANRHFYLNADWQDIVFHHDTVHLNPEGHKRVGKYIAEFLVQENLIPK